MAFNKIGTVSAANAHNYSYDDNVGGLLPVGGSRFFYRLKMLDKDGSFTYSKVEVVACSNIHSIFSISPNPATTSIQVKFSRPINGKADVQLCDVAGKVLISVQWLVAEGSLNLPIAKLAGGTYVVRVNVDGEVWSEKVVVSK